MNTIRSATIVLARFLMTAVFLSSGIHKIFYWRDSEQLMIDALSQWQSHLSFSEPAQQFFSSLVLLSPLILSLTAALEWIGGLLLLLGVKEKLGAVMLMLVLLPMNILFHQFWFLDGAHRDLQQTLFLKDFAILGGLLLVILFGAKTAQKEGSFRF